MRAPRSIYLILGFALAAIPASATIAFQYCNSGCPNSNSGVTYATFETTASAYTFPPSPVTFVAASLSSGVYTDTSGAVFTGYNGTTQESLSVSGTALLQPGGANGSGHSIGITLPPNTFAAAFVLSSVSGFADPYIELVGSPSDFNTSGNFQMVISNSSDSEFYGIISTTPIASIFVGDLTAFQSAITIQSFALGEQGSEAPESATFFTMGGGLVGLYFWRRPRLRNTSHFQTSRRRTAAFALRRFLRPRALIERQVVQA